MSQTDEFLEGYFKGLPPKLAAFARAQRKYLVSQMGKPDPHEFGVSVPEANQIIIRLSQTAGQR